MKHRIVLYFICSKICTFFQFGKFLVVLVAMFLFTQEVEGWRRVRKFFRNVGTIVNRSFGNIGRFVSRFQSSINSSKSQTTNTDSKSSSSNEKVLQANLKNGLTWAICKCSAKQSYMYLIRIFLKKSNTDLLGTVTFQLVKYTF